MISISFIGSLKQDILFFQEVGQLNNSKYYVGSKIISYNYNNNILEEEVDAVYYPLYGDDGIVAIITVFELDSYQPAYTLSTGFSEELNNIVSHNDSSYCLIEDPTSTYFYNSEDIIEIATYAPSLEKIFHFQCILLKVRLLQ